jgi:Predicted membrane protein (DUF2207) C-terminal domain
MIVISQPAQELRTLAWFGLAAVTSYFLVVSIALRWRPRRGVRVAKYDPPAGISPAMAAYLLERGVSDKSFVVAIVNMAAKGYLRIEQGPADYLLSRINASAPLEAEEDVIAQALFSRNVPSVRLSELHKLESIARNVRNTLESSAEPDLISSHFSWFVPALTMSLWCFLVALYPEMDGLAKSDGIALLMFPAFFSVWGLLATFKTLPAMLSKLKSFLPGRTGHPQRLVKADLTALFMFTVAAASLSVIAWATSLQLAMLFGSFVSVNLAGLMALRSPTRTGHQLLDQLSDFRMFFAAVDSDRVNRLNIPNAPSPNAEEYWAWALAFDVEHAWGEQFAAAVLNRLGPDSAMVSIQNNLPEDGRASAELLDLHLR